MNTASTRLPRLPSTPFVRLVRVCSIALSFASAMGCGPRRTSPSTATIALGHHGAPTPPCEWSAADATLDEWHQAAAHSRLDTYLALMADDARFLGTDASERWSKDELRRYAEQPFAEGRGWEMRAIRRDVFSSEGRNQVSKGDLVWFDEDLDTKNLGPARGSGVLRCRADGRFEIVHYVLSVTVPNDVFPAVRHVISGA